MGSLCLLPLELRLEIYSYLLLAINVPSYEQFDRTQEKLAVSLFRVNKRISRETLDYMYTANRFSIVNFRRLKPFSLGDLKRMLPASFIIRNGTSDPQDSTGLPCPDDDGRFLLVANLQYSINTSSHNTKFWQYLDA